MKLDDQVCSLELAKRLKELRVKQDSHFYWVIVNDKPQVVCLDEAKKYYLGESYRSAFTVAELGEMLPILIPPDTPSKSDIYLQYFKAEVWVCCFITMPFQLTIIATAEKEADARAKMLIYLLDKKLITNE